MYGILVDVTKCTACERCVGACVKRNEGDKGLAERDRAVTRDGLSARRKTTVLKVGDGRFARKSCMHCLEPSCVSACLVGGLTRMPEGPVVYDQAKCIGCRYCMLACPFHVPRYEWDETIPYVSKCDMCFDLIAHSQQPACVDACPEGALTFGDRTMLLQKARTLIQQHPEQYLNHIWGEHEFGGTAVMYLSDVDVASLGWPGESAVAIPSLTEPLVHKTPFIGLGVAVGLIGLNWIVRRRNELMSDGRKEEKAEERHE